MKKILLFLAEISKRCHRHIMETFFLSKESVTEVTRNCVHHLFKNVHTPRLLNMNRKIHVGNVEETFFLWKESVTDVTRNFVHHLFKSIHMPWLLKGEFNIWERKLANKLIKKKNIYLRGAQFYRRKTKTMPLLRSEKVDVTIYPLDEIYT